MRRLRRDWQFSAVVLMTLAGTLGGFAVTSAFVDSVLIRPLPYPHAERLVQLTQIDMDGPLEGITLGANESDLFDIVQAADAFDRIGGFNEQLLTMNEEVNPFHVLLRRATPSFLQMLAPRLVRGRLFVESDAAGLPLVALIDYSFWQANFAGRDDVVGQRVRLPRVRAKGLPDEVTVIGVLPQGFLPPVSSVAVTDPSLFPSLWLPLRLNRDESRATRGAQNLSVIALLREGGSINDARAQVKVITDGLASGHPESSGKRETVVTRLKDEVVKDVAATVWLFSGAATCVLLLGFANLVELFAVRFATPSRRRDVLTQIALGADRRSVVLHVLAETACLSMIAAVLGVVFAWAVLGVFVPALPHGFPRLGEIALRPAVIGIVVLTALAVAVALATFPSVVMLKWCRQPAEGRGVPNVVPAARLARLQRCLVLIQVAVAVSLMSTAILFTTSLYKALSVPSGLEEENLWSVTAVLPVRYDAAEKRAGYWRTASESLSQLSVVERLTLAPPPFSGSDLAIDVAPVQWIDNQGTVTVNYRAIGANYFETTGSSVSRGRPFSDQDVLGSPRVAILNELAASMMWPRQDPLGQELVAFGTRFRIIGLVPNARYSALRTSLEPQLFTAYAQGGIPGVGLGETSLLVRLKQSLAASSQLSEALQGLEPDARVSALPINALRWRLAAEERLRTIMVMAFAGAALFLTLLGVYCVVAFVLTSRTREIGVRMAIGASRLDVFWLSAKQAIIPATVGVPLGLLAYMAVSHLLGTFAFGVHPTSTAVLASAAGIVLLTALIAGGIPAVKAASLNPAVALKTE